MAVAGLKLPAGSEGISLAIPGMGTVTGTLYQGLIPVFADVDPDTLKMDPASVQARITRTYPVRRRAPLIPSSRPSAAPRGYPGRKGG